MAKLKDLLKKKARFLVDHPTAFLANSVVVDGRLLRFKNGPKGDYSKGPLTYACGDDDGKVDVDKVVWDLYSPADSPCKDKQLWMIKYKEKVPKSERAYTGAQIV